MMEMVVAQPFISDITSSSTLRQMFCSATIQYKYEPGLITLKELCISLFGIHNNIIDIKCRKLTWKVYRVKVLRGLRG